jgi:LysM repeat protein
MLRVDRVCETPIVVLTSRRRSVAPWKTFRQAHWYRPSGWLLVLAALLLSGCGQSDDNAPVPTLARLEDLATARATLTASPESALVIPSSTVAVAQVPSPIPSATPSFTATNPASPTATVTPSPTVLSTAALEATSIALTNTAIAGILPFTQTAVAIYALTQTAQAQITPSPTPPPLPAEPYQVVFYSDRNGNDDLYLMTLNGVERRLTGSLANEREPSCSPDARSVVFASDATGSYQIYLLPLDQTQPIQLTNSEGMNFAPIFSPDGQQIAFVSTRNDGVPTIWLMNADGSNQRQVTTELGRDTSPSWSPDGRQLLFSSEQFGPWNVFLTVLEEEVEGEFPVLPPEFSADNQLWPIFDPTGERIAYTVWPDLTDPQTADIWLLDFELPEPRAIRAGDVADIAWAWGDDTHLLASVGGPGDVQLALVDITTGEAVRLTNKGRFNGGARLCTVAPEILPPEPTLAPTPTATATPTITPSPTPSPTPTADIVPAALRTAAGMKHIVQPGDTLMRIGYRYGVNWMTLAWLNSLPDPDVLSVGQTLTVPVTRIGYSLRGGYQHPDSDQLPRQRVRKEIVVELDQQVVKAYEDGRLVRQVTVSTGLPQTPTVQGEFSIYRKLPAQTMRGPDYYLPDVPWVMYFYQGYGLHGTYWHDNFGQPMSHGCVNLPTDEAAWFYQWAEIGTPVLVRR